MLIEIERFGITVTSFVRVHGPLRDECTEIKGHGDNFEKVICNHYEVIRPILLDAEEQDIWDSFY
jgi:hypothetical protein